MTSPQRHWIKTALVCLDESLHPIPHETNEIDWKVRLSEKKDRLVEHLIAFSNYPNGGFLVFGINNRDGTVEAVTQEAAATTTNTLANLGRDAIEPKLVIDTNRTAAGTSRNDFGVSMNLFAGPQHAPFEYQVP